MEKKQSVGGVSIKRCGYGSWSVDYPCCMKKIVIVISFEKNWMRRKERKKKNDEWKRKMTKKRRKMLRKWNQAWYVATNNDINGCLYIKVKIQKIVLIYSDRRLKYYVRVVFAPLSSKLSSPHIFKISYLFTIVPYNH